MNFASLAIAAVLIAGPGAAQPPDKVPPQLSASQYRRAEDLYWKVMARCCIRKPGALKIHQQIEGQVAAGQSDEAILADFSKRFGGGPVNLDRIPRESTDLNSNWLLAPPAGIGLLALLLYASRKAQSRTAK